MPSLADGMESGTIIAWLVQDGAQVAAGDDIVEIETDKATMAYQAETGGVLQIIAELGATVPVGEVIARIGEGAVSTRGEPAGPALPADGNGGREIANPVIAAEGPPAAVSAEAPASEPRASPLARRVAGDHGISLEAIQGSGPGGRIIRSDVEKAAGITPQAAPELSQPPAATPSSVPQSAPRPVEGRAKGDVIVEALTRIQQTIARRMSESKATVPDFVIGVDVDMEEAVALRTELKALLPEGEKPPSFNDFIVKASAVALREHPRVNGSYREGQFELFSRVNVGIAVAADGALIVPTIYDADKKSLGEIGREARALALRVRDGSFTPADLSGGTFTVSNLGMFGIVEAVSVINPPQAAILSVGEMRRRAVEHKGEIALRQIAKLRLTCDHRILYGADASLFLGRIRDLLEHPLAMSL